MGEEKNGTSAADMTTEDSSTPADSREILANLILIAKDPEIKTVLFKYVQEQSSETIHKNIYKAMLTS